jgi:hypothetical protein
MPTSPLSQHLSGAFPQYSAKPFMRSVKRYREILTFHTNVKEDNHEWYQKHVQSGEISNGFFLISCQTVKQEYGSPYKDFRVVRKGLLDANLHAELAGGLPRRPPRPPPPEQHWRRRRAPSPSERRRRIFSRCGEADGDQGTTMERRR